MEKNIKIGDQYVRGVFGDLKSKIGEKVYTEYGVQTYEVVNIRKEKILDIDSKLVVELKCLTKLTDNIIKRIGILNHKQTWYKIEDDNLSSIEVRNGMFVKINNGENNIKIVTFKDNNTYIDGHILEDCDVERVRRLFFVKFWKEVTQEEYLKEKGKIK